MQMLNAETQRSREAEKTAMSYIISVLRVSASPR